MARKKKNQPGDIWGDNPSQSLNRIPDEVPRARTLAAKKTAGYRFAKVIVWACVIATPISGLMWLSTNSQMANVRYEIAGIPAPQSVSSPGKSTAFVAMETWLALDPQPLLGGQIISWDGFEDIAKPEQTQQEAKRNPLPDYNFELHSFTLADGNGNLFTSKVQIAVGPGDSGSVAVGTPSLSAVPPTASISVVSPWFGFSRSAAPKAVSNSVAAWATAFTSGDPAKLLLAVGDGNPDHSYMPLYGVKSVSSEVSFASYVPPTGDAAESYTQGQPTGKMIAQVKLIITWDGAPELEQGQRNTTVVTYDILITRANEASPQVVAWGGPGTGPTLETYQNALVDNQIKTTQESGSTFVDPDDGSGDDGTSPTPEPTTSTDGGND